MQDAEIPAKPDEASAMIHKTIHNIKPFCTQYTMFWALYLVSIILMTIGLCIEIGAGDIFTSTLMMILLAAYVGCATFVFRR